MKAVKSILDQKRFEIASISAVSAHEIATAISTSGPDNIQLIRKFSEYLVSILKKCLITTHKSEHLKSAKMWGEYHKLRTSDAFKEGWVKFLAKFGNFSSSAIFCQYITHEMFKEVLKSDHPIAATDAPTLPPLTHLEKNPVRYVAGYVCRKVLERVCASSCAGREAMMLCLSDLNGGDRDDKENTDEWIHLINRGGLWRVSDEAYQLFLIMENEIRQKLNLHTVAEPRQKMIDSLMSNEDLLFQWCFCASDLEEDTTTALLRQLVELFLTTHARLLA